VARDEDPSRWGQVRVSSWEGEREQEVGSEWWRAGTEGGIERAPRVGR
jgi:hypothetical protein